MGSSHSSISGSMIVNGSTGGGRIGSGVDATATAVATKHNIPKEETSMFHTPPPPYSTDKEYYNDNTTPFGAILRGELAATVYAETDTILAFADHRPQATLHALLIPKRYIQSVLDLTPTDLPLLYDLKELGDQLLEQYGFSDTAANSNGHDNRMVFHVPPYNSVSHLHLHVISHDGLTLLGRLKYWHETQWCTSYQAVVRRLELERLKEPITAATDPQSSESPPQQPHGM